MEEKLSAEYKTTYATESVYIPALLEFRTRKQPSLFCPEWEEKRKDMIKIMPASVRE